MLRNQGAVSARGAWSCDRALLCCALTDPRPLLVAGDQSPLLLLPADAKAAAEAIWGWREAALTIRAVRGRKMRTVHGLFDEMAAALQFPYYFEENWAAFDECLADMDWLPMNRGRDSRPW